MSSIFSLVKPNSVLFSLLLYHNQVSSRKICLFSLPMIDGVNYNIEIDGVNHIL